MCGLDLGHETGAIRDREARPLRATQVVLLRLSNDTYRCIFMENKVQVLILTAQNYIGFTYVHLQAAVTTLLLLQSFLEVPVVQITASGLRTSLVMRYMSLAMKNNTHTKIGCEA
jgi:hypothetical protein